MDRVVITDINHADIDTETRILNEAGISFTRFYCASEQDLIEKCKGAECCMNNLAPFTERVFKALAPELKLIVRYGVGVDNVDVSAATKYGVYVCNIPDYSMNEVADQAFAMMMALARKIVPLNAIVKSGVFDYRPGIPLYRMSEATYGIVGLGRIGRTFAKRVRGFGSRIIAFDEFCDTKTVPDYVELVSFDELLAQADMISVHCPLTDKTRHMFNIEAFGKMKKSAYLINVSRGGIVDEADLAVALEQKMIAGAALDVIENERSMADNPLLKFDNCIMSPHVAWYSEESAVELNRKVAEEAVRYIKGEPPLNPVNRINR